jgi:hypothetical protein
MEIYTKINDTEFKEEISETTNNQKVYTIKSLLKQKLYLIEDTENQRKILDSIISNNEMQLERINKLLLKAKELGIN